MITDCVGGGQWDLADTETIFVQGVFAVLKILIAVAVWVYTWKVCQRERTHRRSSVLGLEVATSQLEQSVGFTASMGHSRQFPSGFEF